MIRNSPRNHVLDDDLYFEIAKGNIQNTSHINKFGYNSTVGSTFECICDNGGVYDWDATPSTVSIVSTSTSDVSTLYIEGVLEDFSHFTEIVVLTGTTPVNTTNTNIKHIYRMAVKDVGLVGNISATLSGSVIAQILFDNNQTLMSTYVVPLGYTGYILQGTAATGQGKDATVQFRIRTNDTVFTTVHIAKIYENNYNYIFKVPLPIPEKTVLEVRAKATTGTLDVSASFDIVLIKN